MKATAGVGFQILVQSFSQALLPAAESSTSFPLAIFAEIDSKHPLLVCFYLICIFRDYGNEMCCKDLEWGLVFQKKLNRVEFFLFFLLQFRMLINMQQESERPLLAEHEGVLVILSVAVIQVLCLFRNKNYFPFPLYFKKSPSPVGVVLEGHKDNRADAIRIHTALAMEQYLFMPWSKQQHEMSITCKFTLL